MIVSAARQGIAAYYSRQNLPAALQKAVAWDPANPVYPAALANLIHLYSESADPGEVVQLYQTALRLSPFDAAYTADLAQANDWAGRSSVALPLFQRAQELFPGSPEINWKLANFYVRTGKTNEALPALKKTLSSSVIDKNQIFALCDRARIDPVTVIDKLLPPDPPTLFAYLNFEIDRSNQSAAQKTWDRLLTLHDRFELKETFHYLDALIKSRELDRATQAWSDLLARFPSHIPSPASAINLITNGDFQADIPNGGFDWRVYPASGVVVSQDSAAPAGAVRSVRIDFDGTRNFYYGSILQFVSVKPHTKYNFSVVSRSEGITTDSGVAVQVSDGYDIAKILGSTEPLTGTIPWSDQKFSFDTGADTRLLIVRVVRLPSQKFDNKIAGTFWVSRVSLIPHP